MKTWGIITSVIAAFRGDKPRCPDCDNRLRANPTPDKMTCPNPFCPEPDFAYTSADFPK